MTVVGAGPLPYSQSSLVMMEDRKRPITHDHNDAPPSKRAATVANGAGKAYDKDMPWEDDLEVSSLSPLHSPPSPFAAERQ